MASGSGARSSKKVLSPWSDDTIDERVLAIVERSGAGVKLTELGKLSPGFKPPAARLKARVATLVARGQVHAWATGWLGAEPWERAARGAVHTALGGGPLSAPKLKAALPVALRDARRLPKLVDALVRGHELYADPKTKQYAARPFEARPHLGKLPAQLRALAVKLSPAGIDAPALLAALAAELGVSLAPTTPAPTPVSPGQALLDAMVALRPDARGGVLIELRSLRARLPWPKDVFDREVLALASAGAVALHHHDHPAGLSVEAREAAVVDARGNHFIGVAWRSAT
jgi:hypothetical protein